MTIGHTPQEEFQSLGLHALAITTRTPAKWKETVGAGALLRGGSVYHRGIMCFKARMGLLRWGVHLHFSYIHPLLRLFIPQVGQRISPSLLNELPR